MSIYSDGDIDKVSLSEYCYLEGFDDPYPDSYPSNGDEQCGE